MLALPSTMTAWLVAFAAFSMGGSDRVRQVNVVGWNAADLTCPLMPLATTISVPVQTPIASPRSVASGAGGSVRHV